MTGALDWAALYADLDRARGRRGMTWAAVADAAGVPGPTVWRLARGEIIQAGALLPVIAWAGLNVRDYVRRGEATRPEPAPLPSVRVPQLTITVTLDEAMTRAIDARAQRRAQQGFRRRMSRSAMMRLLLGYGLEHMPVAWVPQPYEPQESGPGVVAGAGADDQAEDDQDDAPDQAAADQLHDAQDDQQRRKGPENDSHNGDHMGSRVY
jgi:hypothetical protein